jgi:hypothetical protein
MLKMAVEGFEDIVPAAVCDKNPESLKNAGGIYPDAGLFSSFDEMLEKAGLDALFVGTPATKLLGRISTHSRKFRSRPAPPRRKSFGTRILPPQPFI